MSAARTRRGTQARIKTTAAHAAPPRVERIALPHRAAMASRYGGKVAHLPVYAGPAVKAALTRRGADGAAVDGAIFLPDATVAPDLVAHEVVHALQQPRATGDTEAFLHRLETARAAPAGSLVENEAGVLASGEPVPGDPAPLHSLPAGVVALRRSGSAAPAAAAPAPAPQPQAQTQGPTAPQQPTPAAAGGTSGPEQTVPGAQSDAAAGGTSPTFTPAPVPDTTLDPAEAAARDAAKAQAEAALAAADSPSAAMDAYAQMAPSVKALNAATLGDRIAQTAESSTSEMEAGTPEVSARLSGERGNLPQPAAIVVPGEQTAAPTPAAAAPAIDVPAGPDQPPLQTDPGYGPRIERIFGSGASPEAVGEQIDDVSTSNPGIQTDITDRADIPLEGANDPAQMDADTRARRAEAASERQAAANAVVTGPGPETIVPREMEHSVAVAAPVPETAPLAAPDGATQLNQMTLPPEVVARFDADTGPAMAASADAARDQMQAAETNRDAAHDQAVQKAETDRTAAEQQADAQQRDAIVSRREAIQAERQHTVNKQQEEVDKVNADAEAARADHRAQADDRVRTDRARINARYDKAEADSQAKVGEGERRAESRRAAAEREAEDQSWWDRATSFIRRAFEALTSAITAIFDAVRSAVATIIDAAVSAVTAIIEAAASALQALVSAFGELLKGLIDHLLGDLFPGLAAALTRFIDAAVSAVNAAIDAIATRLVAAVEAIGAALNAAINALLDVFQNAVNGALAVLEAAMTGDWGALLTKVLDAILGLLGIDPAAFHAMIAQAGNAVGSIVNDPGQFVSNLLDAVVGGIRQFAAHFGAHLRDGIIGWLTGALGGIQMPERWDIWGVLDIVRQVLGLTWDFVRERAARIIGEQNVARLEAAFSWIATLVTEGWSSLWNRLMGQLESLKDTIMEAIRNFVLERVVMAAIRWLASLFSPVGAIVQLVMTIWNIFQFVSNQLQRLFGIARTVIQGLANIARGVLGPAMNRIEEVLANLLPVVIDLLMSLLGVTGVAARVREIIGNVRAAIARAVDNLIDRMLGSLGLRRGQETGQGDHPEGADASTQIGTPVPVAVEGGPSHVLSIRRGGAGGATVMLASNPMPVEDHFARWEASAANANDEAKRAKIHQDIASARQILGALNPIADRAAAAGDPAAREREAHVAEEQERRLAPVLGDLFHADNAAGGEPLTGNLLERSFSMDGESHRLTFKIEGNATTLMMASVSPHQIRDAARAGLDEARTKHMDAAVITDLEAIMRQAEQFQQWCWDHFDALHLPARDDHERTLAEAAAFLDAILHSAVEFGRQHNLKNLMDLGHPSKYVVNDEIRREYRADWRDIFYEERWSSTIESGWKVSELARLRNEASARFPNHPYVLDVAKQAFLVEDRNHEYPPHPEVDYVRPRNVHIDHVFSVSEHFQSIGNDERQPARKTWYELQSNLQILNEHWNSVKGGPRVTDWHVTMNFRGPDE